MKIILYFKAGDPYGDMIRNLLKYHNVDFETFEITNNLEKIKEISGQYSTPVLQVDDKVFVGFDREKIKEVLGIKN